MAWNIARSARASIDDAVSLDDYRRAEEVGVTDVLTMPWLFYGGFKQDLQGKLDGLHRFADDKIRPQAEHIHRENADIPESILEGMAEIGRASCRERE